MNIYTGFLFSCLVSICTGASTWDYNSQGSDWPKHYDGCGKKEQSPIDIKGAECNAALNNSITFTNYDTPGSSKFDFENNGHSVVLSTSTTGANIKLDKKTFNLLQVHFHWGKDDSKGSEHLVKGTAHPAEMHLVHMNARYSSLDDAKTKTDGLAVLGVFIKVGKENPTFKTFLSKTSSISESGTNTTVNQFAMEKLLPKNHNVFYRYSGSLTTPTCDQSVTWTVFKEPIELSKSQLAQFRVLKDSKNKTLVDNYRKEQKLNGRKIEYWDEKACSDGAEATAASIFSVLLSFLIFTLY